MNIQDTTLVFTLGSDNNFSNLKINSKIKHFIADLRGVDINTIEKVKNNFVKFDETMSQSNSSFIIVCEFSFSDILKIVPTLQEAYDYIELEEIERQLKH